MLLLIQGVLSALILVGCGGGSDGGGSSTVNPAPPPGPRVQTIWANGSNGCWNDPGDNCGSGGPIGRTVIAVSSGVGFGSAAITDPITGGLPSGQMTSSVSLGVASFCIGDLNGFCRSRDLSAFSNGHLQFDIRLESPTVTSVSMTLFTGLTYQIPMNSLTLGQFVHISIPLTPTLFGTNGPQQVSKVCEFEVTNSAPTGNQPVLILNDIKWTSN